MPMAHKSALECTDQLYRTITGNNIPFGGKVFLGIGDFRQVAPVVRGAGKSETINASIRSSQLWPFFSHLKLYAPIRNASDLDYATWVDTIGQGNNLADEYNVSLDKITNVSDLEEAIQFLYPTEILNNAIQSIHNSFLSPLNIFVNEFNDAILNRFPGDEGMFQELLNTLM